MSYSIFLMRFEHSHVVDMDAELFHQALGPYVVERDRNFVQIRAEDGGEADVYGSESVLIDHFSPGAVLDVIAQLASQLGATLVLQEGTALIFDRGQLEHLPDDLQSGAQVIDITGAAIEAAIRSA